MKDLIQMHIDSKINAIQIKFDLIRSMIILVSENIFLETVNHETT